MVMKTSKPDPLPTRRMSGIEPMKTAAVLIASVSLLAVAGAASAQNAAPEQVGKGSLIVTARMTGVLPQADDAIVTAAGADSGDAAEKLLERTGQKLRPALSAIEGSKGPKTSVLIKTEPEKGQQGD